MMSKYKWDLKTCLPYLIGGGFWWYFYSISPPFLASMGQSTQILRIGILGGNMDLPMFGLLLRLIHLLSGLPLPGYKLGYLLASGLAGVGLGLFYSLLTVMEADTSYRGSKIAYGAKILAVIGLSQTLAYKLQGIWLERYMFPLVLMLIAVLLTYEIFQNRQAGLLMRWLSLILMMGISVHWAFLGLTGLVAAAWYLKMGGSANRHIWHPIGWLMLVILGGIITAYLLGFRPTPESTYFAPPTIASLLTTYHRAYWADGWQLNSQINPTQIMSTARWLVEDFIGMIGMGGFIIGLIGLGLLYHSKNQFWRYYLGLAGWLIVVPLMSLTGINNRLQISQWVLVWWLVVWASGWWRFLAVSLDRLHRALNIIHSPKRVNWVLSLGFLIVAGGWLSMGRKTPAYVADEEKLMSEIFAQLPENTILFCFDPAMCASAIYVQNENGIGENITIIPYDYQPDLYRFKIDELRPFDYRTYPYMIHEIMATALASGRPVASLTLSPQYWQWLGFELGIVHYIPQGNFGWLALKTPGVWPEVGPLKLEVTRPGIKESPVSPVIIKLIDSRISSARVDFLSNRYNAGYEEMNTTAAQVWKLSRGVFNAFANNRNTVENWQTQPLFAQATETEPASLLLEQVPGLITAQRYNRAIDFCRGALMLEPFNKTVREQVAGFYEQMGLPELAKQEKLNAAKIIK